MDDLKVVIVIVLAIVAMMVCFTIGQMNKDNRIAQCKIAAMALNRTPAEIEILCK